MTFVNDNNEVLETADEVAITKQAVSFFGFKIKGDYSVNFTVPNNSVTRRVLNYEGPQMLNQVAFTRQAFTLMRDGNPFMRGAIVIQDDTGDTLDCYFVSGNSNWLNLLQGLITELDYSGQTNGISYQEQMSDSLISTTLGRTSGVIVPFADWACNLNRGNNYYGTITDSAGNIFLNNFPCMYVHSLVEEIAKQNGIKIAGNIVDDVTYNSFVLMSYQGIIERPFGINTYGYGSYQAISNVFSTYTSITSETDPLGQLNLNGAGNLFTSVTDALVSIYIQVTCVEPTTVRVITPGGGFRDYVIPGNTDIYGPGHILIPGNTGQTYSLDGDDAIRGYTIDIQVKANTATTPNFRIDQILFQTPKNNTGSDFFLPNYFLPALKSIDIIKHIVSSLGCCAYYNDTSKTVTINIIEKLKMENAVDWSEYHLSHRAEYTVDQAKNNYFRVAPSEDSNITAYNKRYSIGYGEGNITTQNNLKDTNDLYKSPFAVSETDIGKNGIYQTNVPLINLTDDGDGIEFTSITNSGGLARFTAAAGTFTSFISNEICRIVSGNIDIGYFVVSTVSLAGAGITFLRNYFTVTNTGKIYRQKATSQKLTPRIGIAIPSILVSSISSYLEIYKGIYTLTSVPYVYFTKPKTNKGLDDFKINAAYNNPEISTFSDPTLTDLYFNKITNIFNNPTIRMQMLLPEAVFQSFDFGSFIYVKTEDLDGYFFVDSIVNYKDGNTPVEVNLYML